MLILVGFLFVLTHLGVSSTKVRGHIVRFVGEKVYLLTYSMVALVFLFYFIWIYLETPRYDYLWMPNPDLYWLAKLSMPLACILLVGGFMVRNPSNVGQDLSDDDDVSRLVTGVVCITRHPVQWAIVLWGIGHVTANGDIASIIFFSIFVLLSGTGSILLDLKKSKQFGRSWREYELLTSNVPFIALLEGRTVLRLKELYMPVALGLLLYSIMYYFHEMLTGSIIV